MNDIGANNDMLLGQLLANQKAMREKQDEMATKLDEIEKTLIEHRDVFTFLKGQRSALVWVGSAIIAAATAMGLTANKLIVWLSAR